MAIIADLQNKINALFGYTPTQAQLLANPDLLEIAVDACGVNVATLTDVANSLNTLLGTSYNAAQLSSRPDLVKLGLKNLQSSLPNGALIGGVCYIIYTPTIPVPVPQTRPNSTGAVVGGAPLVIGDVWFNTSTGVQAYWNGTEFLGQTIVLGIGAAFGASGNVFTQAAASLNASFRLISFTYEYFVAGVPLDGSNYWTFNVFGTRPDGVAATNAYTGLSNVPITVNQANFKATIAVNQMASFANGANCKGYQLAVTKIGAAPPLYINTHAIYREVL